MQSNKEEKDQRPKNVVKSVKNNRNITTKTEYVWGDFLEPGLRFIKKLYFEAKSKYEYLSLKILFEIVGY